MKDLIDQMIHTYSLRRTMVKGLLSSIKIDSLDRDLRREEILITEIINDLKLLTHKWDLIVEDAKVIPTRLIEDITRTTS